MPRPEPKSGFDRLTPYRPDVAGMDGGGRIIRLSVNESALGPSPAAMAALTAPESFTHRYPEQIHAALAGAIAKAHNLDAARILPANGSDELLGLIAQSYLAPGDEAVITQYGFLVFAHVTRVAGGVPVFAPDDSSLTASVDAILAAITPRTKIIFLANPNNPTGTFLPRDEVARLIAKTPPHIIIVLDSAYAEYVGDETYDAGAGFVESHDNVVMTRTFSKIYGLAGLRLGWGYMPAAVFKTLAAVRAPFSVNTAAALAGMAAVGDRGFIAKAVSHNTAWLPRMRESIRQAGFEALPSAANFFLIRFADAAAAKKAAEFFAERGILLRGMAPYGLADCLRMSLGNDEEMEITAAAFKDLAQEFPENKKTGKGAS